MKNTTIFIPTCLSLLLTLAIHIIIPASLLAETTSSEEPGCFEGIPGAQTARSSDSGDHLELATKLLDGGKLLEAEQLLFKEYLSLKRSGFPSTKPALNVILELSKLCVKENRYLEAELFANEAFALASTKFGAQSIDVIPSVHAVGMSLAGQQGRAPEALTTLKMN